MNDTVIVRLRYAVTGSISAAKDMLHRYHMNHHVLQTTTLNDNYSAKCIGVDIDPDEVGGYSTYETFHVAMFLSNDRERHEQCLTLARKALLIGATKTDPDTYSDATIYLVDALKHQVEDRWLKLDVRDTAIIGLSGLFHDTELLAHELLTAALGRVNWLELAEEWLNTAREG